VSDLQLSCTLCTLAVSDKISQKRIFIDNNQTVIPEKSSSSQTANIQLVLQTYI